MKKGILLHESDDDVGVATMDLAAGETVQALTLEGEAGHRDRAGRRRAARPQGGRCAI